jgi:plasmid maintenance system killer protein
MSMIEEGSFLHKGLQRLWESGGDDHGGIQPAYKKLLMRNLHHLSVARSLNDIEAGWGRLKHVERLSGQANRFSMEVNANDRLTFTCENGATGLVTKIDLEDTHRRTGAKRR